MNYDDIDKMLDDAVNEFDEQEEAPSSPAQKSEDMGVSNIEKTPDMSENNDLAKEEELEIERFVEEEFGSKFLENKAEIEKSQSIVPSDNRSPIMNVIVEYRDTNEKETVAVIIDPENMPGVEGHEFEVDHENIISAMTSSSASPEEVVKDHLLKNHFADIEKMVEQLKANGYISTSEDYAQSIDDMSDMLAKEVSKQLEKDRKKHQEMIDDLVRFGVDNIRHGSNLEAERFVEENVDFDVSIEGKGKDPSPEDEPKIDAKKDDVGKFADMRANVSMMVAGRSISLGSMDYFYGIYEKKNGGVTREDIKGSEAYDAFKSNVYSMVLDGTLPVPRWLTMLLLEKKLVNEVNRESAKHFGVEHKALQNPKNEDERAIFAMQVDQDITKEEARALREAENEKKMEIEKAKENELSNSFSPSP